MRALVLSGGGAKGAYQVGALSYMVGDLRLQYDIVCGVSVGALNAAHLAMYPKGWELRAIEELRKIWNTIDDSKIFRNRYPIGSFLSAILSSLSSKSLYDTSPLMRLVRENIDLDLLKFSGKELRVGAVSLNTGEYREWDQNSKDIADAVIASSAFPGFFTPIEIDGELWTDGGVREVVPVTAAVDLGATEIDIISLSTDSNTNLNVEAMNVIQGAPVILDAMGDEIADNDIELALLKAPKSVSFRVLRPSVQLLRNPLNFDPKKIQQNMELGYEEARKISW